MTLLWPEGELINVTSDALALPQTFLWQGQLHPVQQIAKQWREDQGWWKRRVWREYFKVATATGLLVIIYHDLLTESWYLQRLYD